MPALELEQVTHTVALGFQVALVVRIGRNSNGELLDDLQSMPLKADDVLGVVGQKTDLFYAQIRKHLSSKAVVSQVHGEAELQVGFDGV